MNSAFIEHLNEEGCLECVTLVFTIFLIVQNNFSVVMELSKFLPGKLLAVYLGRVVRKPVDVNPGFDVN